MTYLKMTSRDATKHLISAEQGLDDVTTLCGCTVTRSCTWVAVTTLEGDECEKCAAVSFSVARLRNWLDGSDRALRGAVAAHQTG